VSKSGYKYQGSEDWGKQLSYIAAMTPMANRCQTESLAPTSAHAIAIEMRLVYAYR
jgi:hypothetical protein